MFKFEFLIVAFDICYKLALNKSGK